MKYQRKRKSMKEKWKCHFVGEGQEDIRDIIKRTFVQWLNDQQQYPVISLREDLIKEYGPDIYKKKKPDPRNRESS
ncbi:hypothetical protein M3196_00375 [Fictibacillus nanhaiensis]|uniref:hypothetical protein n=1 Tax=Fictibacillus nanhaiensis TaxID=742169 RepID=UPI00203B5D1F|nr:hypothetical protein [Fictibacillus nanhaiensis]MCM3730123.1 hypothetical protein [Fictibacillus nanhaiensis]